MRFIAVDWGTTNRRALLIVDGAVVAAEQHDRGAAVMAPDAYPQEIAGIRARLGDEPMLLAGMVGSTIGWREVPYAPVPACLGALAASLCRIDARTAIVPGVSLLRDGRADVMRGEEVQLLGAVAAGLAPRDALLCQPGTHCKWARIADGAIVDFTTAMTGELFSLLRTHSLLRHQLGGDVVRGAVFLAGAAEGAGRDLSAGLFAIRARAVLGIDRDATSFASGLLIGADVAARVAPGDHVHIIADPGLAALYGDAIAALGGTSSVIDSRAAFVAGITRIQELAR